MKKPPARPELAPATISEADGVRYLHLGTPWVQGAMRMRKPLAIELEYVQRMMVWMLLRPSDELGEGHAVQLGLGAGAITRYCHGVLHMRTTAIELNPMVLHDCRGPVVLSGYPSPLYDDLFTDWHRVELRSGTPGHPTSIRP